MKTKTLTITIIAFSFLTGAFAVEHPITPAMEDYCVQEMVDFIQNTNLAAIVVSVISKDMHLRANDMVFWRNIAKIQRFGLLPMSILGNLLKAEFSSKAISGLYKDYEDRYRLRDC
jgi:hypothetical protein